MNNNNDNINIIGIKMFLLNTLVFLYTEQEN